MKPALNFKKSLGTSAQYATEFLLNLPQRITAKFSKWSQCSRFAICQLPLAIRAV